jgi:hypothetical protein
MRLLRCLLVLLSVAGCYESGVVLGGDGEDHADIRPDAGADGDADADADADGDADVPPECPPALDGVWADFMVDGSAVSEARIDLPCVIDSVIEDAAGSVRINLGCGTGGIIEAHTLDITASPGPWLFGLDGLSVRFRYEAEPVWWINRWFSLRDTTGYVMVAGVSADDLAPPGSTPSEWFAPANVDLVGGVCPPTDDWCGPLERLALQIAYYGDTQRIYDGNSASVGLMMSVYVIVGGATRYIDVACDDAPSQFLNALLFTIPEG